MRLVPFGDGNALAFEVGTREFLPIAPASPARLGELIKQRTQAYKHALP